MQLFVSFNVWSVGKAEKPAKNMRCAQNTSDTFGRAGKIPKIRNFASIIRVEQ